ncbi:thioredoxin [Parapedomonas caeni]
MALDPAATPTAGLVASATAETFRELVIDASQQALVLVDFWAEWCGPCKQLTPLLEKVVADYAGKVRLVKINVDQNQMLAGQFRVQSIPTVYAFLGGRPLDGFMGGLPESQLRAFIDRLLAAAGPLPDDGAPDVTALLEAAAAALEAGDIHSAQALYADVLELDPANAAAAAGMARLLVDAGELDEAEALLATLPEAAVGDTAVSAVRAAIALAREAAPVDDLAALKAEVEANPADHARRFELAGGLMAAGDREGAVDHLLEIIRRDRNWNEGAARTRLLQLFEAVGLEDPFTMAARRRLSAVLFA